MGGRENVWWVFEDSTDHTQQPTERCDSYEDAREACVTLQHEGRSNAIVVGGWLRIDPDEREGVTFERALDLVFE